MLPNIIIINKNFSNSSYELFFNNCNTIALINVLFFSLIFLPYSTLLLGWKVIGGPHDWPIYTKGASFDVHKEANLKSLILEQSMAIHLSSSP
jgi:hypothetical protein